jgi:hypothetical protein
MEPAFNWWVPYTLRKRNKIIKKVKAKYWRTTHKFGIRIPKSVEEALLIDMENGNLLWRDAVDKDMRRAKVSYTARKGQHHTTFESINATPCGDIRRPNATSFSM